jgi:Na+/H+ antiporter NhaD/arsenite permease-like protein
VPFLILIATLFTIGGGIHVAGSLRGTPLVNGALMIIGMGLASFVGTTGAAMVMIRPLLKANRHRHHRAHTVVFFIFLVANIGGGLTPPGDPPLFLGFLHGVPFF